MRGQAFIVFESVTFASSAKRGLSGFSFYGKPLDISYSTGSKSKALLRRELGDEAVQEMDLEKSRTTESKRGEKRGNIASIENDEDEEEDGRKRVKRETEEEEEEEGVVVRAVNIPNSIEEEVISALFSRQQGYSGLEERTKQEDGEEESWTANIRFKDAESANNAKAALEGVQIDPTYRLELSIES